MIGPSDKKTIVLVGAGRMGGAMLRGWIAALGPGYRFIAIDPHAGPSLSDIERSPLIGPDFQHVENASNLPHWVEAAAVVLATKPQMTQQAVQGLTNNIGEKTVVISVAAGVTIDTISRSADLASPVVRVMPNIGAMVGHSASAGIASDTLEPAQRELVETLFSALGSFVWLEAEEEMHTATALSGSGPAYIFAMCEALIGASTKEWLNEETARSLAIGTLSAAARLLEQDPNPKALREMVTSPNGTTEAGLKSLTGNNELMDLISLTVSAARRRSIELS